MNLNSNLLGGGWEKIEGDRKSNVSERLFAFLREGTPPHL